MILTLYVKTDATNESTMSLTMPLAEKSIAMTVKKEFASEKNSTINSIVASKEEKKESKIIPIVVLAISSVVMIITGYLLFKYIKDTMTEEEIYKSEKKKIVSVYGELINQIEDYDFSSEDYNIIKLNKFADLIKIKEDLSLPILMVEGKSETNTMFFIQNNVNIIYMFVLSEKRPLLAQKNPTEDKSQNITV